MLNAILLAAGESRRFGSPKALAKFDDGSYVIERLVSNMLQVDGLEITVVLGAHADQVEPLLLKHTNIRIVYNKDYNFGQTSSFQKGVAAAPENAQGFLLQPVDCPLIKPTTLRQIMANFNALRPRMLVPAFGGKKGHPPVFHAGLKEEIIGLDAATGLNAYQKRYAAQTVLLETADEGVVLTFNTPEEFGRMQVKAASM